MIPVLLKSDAVKQAHQWEKNLKCENVIMIDLVHFAHGLHTSSANFYVFIFCIKAPCLGLYLNLHDDPNMDEQKTALLT